jgi:septum formation protein
LLILKSLQLMSDSAQIYLASASPRRRELLDQIGIRYRLLPVEVPEVQLPGESPAEYVQRVALEKARVGWRLAQDHLPVLAADTAVVVDGVVFGKPHDRQSGLYMLSRLSGRTHEVLSAVALVAAREEVRLNISRVTFRHTTPAEQRAYWASGEPFDKAGSYAIQGRAAAFIRYLQGSYSGVMGLPLYETAELLGKFGVSLELGSP